MTQCDKAPSATTYTCTSSVMLSCLLRRNQEREQVLCISNLTFSISRRMAEWQVTAQAGLTGQAHHQLGSTPGLGKVWHAMQSTRCTWGNMCCSGSHIGLLLAKLEALAQRVGPVLQAP